MKEIWNPIVGFEGIYEISNMGRVKSNSRITSSLSNMGRYTINESILRPGKDSGGYSLVVLRKEGRNYPKRVHVLVLESFLSSRPVGCVTNHINGNKQDNRIENLEWCSYSHNLKHAYDNKLRRNKKCQTEQDLLGQVMSLPY